MRAIDPLDLPAGTRPFTPEDAGAITAILHEAHGQGDFDGITRHFLDSSVDRVLGEPSLAVVVEDAGQIAGWVVPIHDELTVAPAYRRRGHGRQLVTAGRRVALAMGRQELQLWVPRRPGPEAFAEASGMAYSSSLWALRRDPSVPVAEAAFPSDLVIRALVPGADEPAFVELANETFLDHPSPLVLTIEEARRAHSRSGFDPASILLVAPAADPARLVAFCRISRHPDDTGRTVGDVRLVGVRRGYRGRGLGRSLVTWGIGELMRAGVDELELSVEGRNAGALRLYESLGFQAHVEWPHWTIPAARTETVSGQPGARASCGIDRSGLGTRAKAPR